MLEIDVSVRSWEMKFHKSHSQSVIVGYGMVLVG
jgi:hypothetical protein